MHHNELQLNGDYQEAVGKMVDNEIHANISALIPVIAASPEADEEEIFELRAQPDHESGIRNYLDDCDPAELVKIAEEYDLEYGPDSTFNELRDMIQRYAIDDDPADFCVQHEIDCPDQEALEHWIVSDWLAGKLDEHGEIINRDFFGLTVWGRCTTGQSIALDGVLCDIFNTLHDIQINESGLVNVEHPDGGRFFADDYIELILKRLAGRA